MVLALTVKSSPVTAHFILVPTGMSGISEVSAFAEFATVVACAGTAGAGAAGLDELQAQENETRKNPRAIFFILQKVADPSLLRKPANPPHPHTLFAHDR